MAEEPTNTTQETGQEVTTTTETINEEPRTDPAAAPQTTTTRRTERRFTRPTRPSWFNLANVVGILFAILAVIMIIVFGSILMGGNQTTTRTATCEPGTTGVTESGLNFVCSPAGNWVAAQNPPVSTVDPAFATFEAAMAATDTALTSTQTTATVGGASVGNANTSSSTQPITLTCPDNRQIEVPADGQLFPATVWVNDQPIVSADFSWVYDPGQSGHPDLTANGWTYQPCLPSPDKRVFHEASLTLEPGIYRFTGPECRVWWNDGDSPGREGRLLLDKENRLEVEVPETANGESWVFIECDESWAGGASFSFVRDSAN